MAYPGIQRAAVAIAYDNGGINRFRPEAQMIDEFNVWIAGRGPVAQLVAIDAWLTSLTDDEIEVLCTYGEEENEHLLKQAPTGTDELLNTYFEEIC